MSNEIKDKAKEYLKAGLSVIPTKEDKTPAVQSWKQYQKEILKEEDVDRLFKAVGLSIITGSVSGNLEVIDVDTKYDLTGSLWDELNALLRDNLPDLYNSLGIAKTKSGGYHIYYKCSSISGNQKLAQRYTTEEERGANYKKELEAGATEVDAKKRANNDKVRVLIETRGEGGYVVAPPTTGYKYLQGDPTNIITINPEDRELILNITRGFNEVYTLEEPKEKKEFKKIYPGKTSLEDYDERGDIVGLLLSQGWSQVLEDSEKVYLLKPGISTSKAKHSANFHKTHRALVVFSSSTEFDIGKPYSPSQIYNMLLCNGDWSKTALELGKQGYGDYRPNKNSKELKTERIKVEVVNQVNRKTSVISTPGDSLQIDNIQTAIGEEVVITSPGSEAQEEVLKAIALIQETGKRIYIKEGPTELREYRYQLQAIFNKYGTIQEESGGLTDRDRDSLLDEVVIVSTKLQPIDKDIFLKEFIELEAIKELGISEESLSITVDRLTSTRDKEAQAKEFKKLLSDATQLQDKGETEKALELLDSKVKEVKITGARDLLPPPISFTTLLDEIATLPPAYKTGYSSLDSFIGFTPGAITLIAGRPSHGKTTFMFNLLLEMSKLYKNESFYFFTYEEPLKNISIKLLNRLIDTDLSGYFREVRDLSTPTNYEFIKSYIKARRTDISQIEEGKRQLQELIDSQRIKVIDRNYSVEELSSLIAYLNKRERIGGVFIDYIQRMKTDAKTQDMRTKIAHISDSVLQIAKESGLPIILGAQLNRATQDSKGGKPKLENLKEAGNLEEDANTVLSVYNESREKDETSEGESYKGLREVELEIKALKNREGEVNQTALLTFDKWTGVIKNSSSSGNSIFK